jgi:hypothetical protein
LVFDILTRPIVEPVILPPGLAAEPLDPGGREFHIVGSCRELWLDHDRIDAG